MEPADRFYMEYPIDRAAELCKECSEEFLNWMKNEPKKEAEDLRNIVGMSFEEYQAMLKELVQELIKADYPGFKGE
jgi:hypothetical protein